jgi:putative transposase
MLFAQFTGRKSLRDLVFSLNRQVHRLYHLGQSRVKRSTLAEANEKRPAVIFEKTYQRLLPRVYEEMARQHRRHPEIKIVDATTIELCASVFPWAHFREKKGAVKLHTVLVDSLPQCVILSDGKKHDLAGAKEMQFAPGDLLILDRAYIDYAWLYGLHRQGVWFVTRLKSNARYEVVAEREIAASDPFLADQLIRLTSARGQAAYPEELRRVQYRDPETGKVYVFLTNRLDLPALEVAALYKQRWQIELFFKWLKQNLKIKAFFGTSKNAVLIQIWTALLAYLLLIWVKLKSTVGWGLLELSRLMQTMLMARTNLWEMLNPKEKAPPPQMVLFNVAGGV